MAFKEKLAEYIIKHKLEQKDIAELLGVSGQTISAYITGKNKPTYDTFITLCNLLKVDAHYFMQDELKYIENELPHYQQLILNRYNNLSDSDKRIVDFILKINEKENAKPIIKYESIVTDDVIYFPLVKQKASAGIGDPTHQLSNDLDKAAFPLKEVPIGTTHTIIIEGYSMEPIFFDGQIVFINAKKDCSDGDYGIFQVITDDQTNVYCKQLKYNEYGRRYLHSVSSRASDPEFIEKDGIELYCIGKILM